MSSKRPQRDPTDIPRAAKHSPQFLFAGNPIPMWIHDVSSLRFLEVNESAERQYGYSRSEFLSLTLNDLNPPEEVPVVQEPLRSGNVDPDRAWIHIKKDKTQIHVRMRANDVRFRGRQGKLVVAEDVTERRHLDAQLIQMAHHDALTGLPNRILLQQRMGQTLAAAQKRGHRAAVICLDLDRFKQVNDWYGHAIGDECLKQVGIMLTRRLRGMDTVARTGGEEFTIVLGEVESMAAAGIVAKALLQVFASMTEIEGHRIVLGASAGVAVYPDHGVDGSELWRSADAAMYRAKRAGGNRYMLVASGIAAATIESAGVESHIRTMLETGGFRLHYQLQYARDGQIRGMEALLRLPHPSLGYVSPDRFIPVAEGNGLIHPLGKWVIEEACRQLTIWNSHTENPVRIAVNVSPLQLMRPDFAAEVRQAISDSGIDPAWLEMEITERVVVNFEEEAVHMEQLAKLGIRFAIDDFGTGYSSLQQLCRLPISTLKIDCSFVRQLSESSRSYPIVQAIIAMGHSLKLQVIAEGVEDEDQMRILWELGCDCIQGFLLSRPSPPEIIEPLLRQQEYAENLRAP